MVRAGAALSLVLTLVLILKAEPSRRQDYRHTEMWLLLEREERPPREIAQRLSATALRETHFHFPRLAAGASVSLWFVALILPDS